MLRSLSVLVVVLLGSSQLEGCDDGVATQTLVFVAVDPALDGTRLRVRAWNQEGGLAYDETRPADGSSLSTVLPARAPLDPENGDATRRFRVQAELLDAAGATMHTERAEAGYVLDERREIWLCLDAGCDAAACTDDQRCVNGSCAPVAIETQPAGTSTVGTACDFQFVVDGGAEDDAGVDAGEPCECPCPSDTCDDGVCSPVSTAADVSVGDAHACGIDAAGRLFCWGENSDGRLADTSRNARSTPTTVPLGPARQVSAGRRHTCALLVDGTLHCWGWGNLGQIGEGREDSDVPLPQLPPDTITHPPNGWSQVSAGGTVTCAVHGDSLFCWGSHREGQLGIGGTLGALDGTPNRVSGTWRQVSAGDKHVCALRNDVDGTVACWGEHDNRRLGLLDDPLMDVGEPRNVRGSRTRHFVSVDVGYEHTCAVHTTRELRCWGRGADGRLGLGSTFDVGNAGATMPEPPEPSFRWDHVAAGAAHTCGLAEDGALWCWGANRSGELGLGEGVGEQLFPMRVGAESWNEVETGQDFTCGIHTDGRIYCWGANDSGQLGLEPFEARPAPTEPVCLPSL